MHNINHIEEALGWARNQQASFVVLEHLVEYSLKTNNRQLFEALLFNKNLSSQQIDRLISNNSLDLQLLAIIHPNLSKDRQQQIVTSIEDQDKRIQAKVLLLSRPDLEIEFLTVLCLDDNKIVRNKALQKLKERK
jgi:hypothetical protein